MKAVQQLLILSETCVPKEETVISPFHTLLFQACLEAINYRAALPILDREVFVVKPKKTALNVENYMLYFYYGGLINVGLKRYEKALECFKTVRIFEVFKVDDIKIYAFI